MSCCWRDDTKHPVKSPLKFMQRPAALVPRPRLHLIRFYGVLTPNAQVRNDGAARAGRARQGTAAGSAILRH